MSGWWLIGVLFLIAFSACGLMVYPLCLNFKSKVFCAIFIGILVFTGYFFWGGFTQWNNYVHQKKSHVIAQEILKSIKDPQQLIDILQAKLREHPKHANGWYLLGRLYVSQHNAKNAAQAFATAYYLKPHNEQFAVNYAHSLWELNKHQFNAEIIKIFAILLKNNPKQPDALAMLAMNAFMRHDYEDAIGYWQRLLKLAPQQSEEALAIRQAIAKAQGYIN